MIQFKNIAKTFRKSRVLDGISLDIGTGFVPQLPPPLKMPVGQLINFSASLCATDPQRIHAIALGREASVLVMDEPAANFPATRRWSATCRCPRPEYV